MQNEPKSAGEHNRQNSELMRRLVIYAETNHEGEMTSQISRFCFIFVMH